MSSCSDTYRDVSRRFCRSRDCDWNGNGGRDCGRGGTTPLGDDGEVDESRNAWVFSKVFTRLEMISLRNHHLMYYCN